MSQDQSYGDRILVLGDTQSLSEGLERIKGFENVAAVIFAGKIQDHAHPAPSPFPVYTIGQVPGTIPLDPDVVQEICGARVLYSDDSTKLSGNTPSIDLLISTEWPSLLGASGSETVTALARAVNPLYHIVPESKPRYLECFHTGSRSTSLTALGPVGAPGFYAEIPLDNHGVISPVAVTGINYYQLDQSHPHDIVWGTKIESAGPVSKRKSKDQDGRTNKGRRRDQPCFLCLNSGATDEDLIITVGSQVYLSTAKGPLQIPAVEKSLGCFGHVLIVPRNHVPTFTDQSALIEAHKHKVALALLFKQNGLGYVWFEFVRKRTIHGHIQVVPVPQDQEEAVKSEILKQLSENLLTIVEKRPVEDHIAVGFGSSPVTYALLPPSIDLQFPRRAICTALKLSETQQDWRQCLLPNERSDAQVFSQLFSDVAPKS